MQVLSILLLGCVIGTGVGGYDWEQTAWWDDGPATWNSISEDSQSRR